MTTAGWIALAITVFGAFSYAAASILQAVAARRSASTVETLRHPLYLIGIGCDILAWVGSMIALRELAVYLVESVLAGSLAVTVVAARFVLRSRLRRRDVAAVVVSVAALATLAMSAGPQANVAASTELRVWFCAAAVSVAVAGWAATKVAPAGVVAALGGLCLGGAALVGRALPMPPTDHWTATAQALVTEPLIAALLMFAATGMLLYAHALQHGQVGPVTAVHWTAEVVAPSAVALVLLGDTVRAGWALPAAIAGVATVGAAVLLSTAPATYATANPTEAVPAVTAAPAEVTPAGAALAVPAPVPVRRTEKVIWWGPPPIWIPPTRATAAALEPPAVPQLTWNPAPARSPWSTPRRPFAGPADLPARGEAVPAAPVAAAWPPAEQLAEPVPASPWQDPAPPRRTPGRDWETS